MGRIFSALAVIGLACVPFTALCATYSVGPGETRKAVSDVAALLEPGDIVEVTGDITESILLTRHGTPEAPITIRGVKSTANDKTMRPRIRFPEGYEFAIMCRGNWNVIEGFDIAGANSSEWDQSAALWQDCDNLVIRDCFFHHNTKAIGTTRTAGSILIEFCEFDSNGSPPTRHTVDIWSCESELAKATVQYCFFHDATYGALLKSHCTRNVVRYNWFENGYNMVVAIVDSPASKPVEMTLGDPWYPMHTDIVGNVFHQGWSPGPRYAILSLGGEHATTPGTEGDFHIAHNLFVTTNGGISPAVPLLINGNVDRVRVYNNVFLEYGVTGCHVYMRGSAWKSPRTRQFVKRRGTDEPSKEGANNWISDRAIGVPDEFLNSVRGSNPLFENLLAGNYRPAKGSPLAGAGVWPLPSGRIIDLAPEFEPQRGIPADLKPRPRRKVTLPSIGPFEVAE